MAGKDPFFIFHIAKSDKFSTKQRKTMNDPLPTNEEVLAAVSAIQAEAISFLQEIVSIDSTLQKGEGEGESFLLSND